MLKNTMKNTIVENRYIGKVQLTADDMGGVGCDTWNQYRQLSDNLAKAAWNHAMGKEVDREVLGVCVSALFNFFDVETVDSSKYHARILAMLVERKPQSSQALKDARRMKSEFKKAYDYAMGNEEQIAADNPIIINYTLKRQFEEDVVIYRRFNTIEELKTAYDQVCDDLADLYLKPMHFWYDPVPMLDKSKKHATAKARKALEDTCADIINERAFMSAEELAQEYQELADRRAGAKARKKKEEKGKANK